MCGNTVDIFCLLLSIPPQGHTNCCAVLLTLPSHSHLILVILSFCSFGAHLFILSHWFVLFTFSLSCCSRFSVSIGGHGLGKRFERCLVLVFLFYLYFINFSCMENGSLPFHAVEEPVLSLYQSSLSPLSDQTNKVYLQQSFPFVYKLTSAPATPF